MTDHSRLFHSNPNVTIARDLFVKAQDGLCAICRRPFTDAMKPALDHCHARGYFRGALCTSCNTKLGWFEKNRTEVIAYLRRAEDGYHKRNKTRPRRLNKALPVGEVSESVVNTTVTPTVQRAPRKSARRVKRCSWIHDNTHNQGENSVTTAAPSTSGEAAA